MGRKMGHTRLYQDQLDLLSQLEEQRHLKKAHTVTEAKTRVVEEEIENSTVAEDVEIGEGIEETGSVDLEAIVSTRTAVAKAPGIPSLKDLHIRSSHSSLLETLYHLHPKVEDIHYLLRVCLYLLPTFIHRHKTNTLPNSRSYGSNTLHKLRSSSNHNKDTSLLTRVRSRAGPMRRRLCLYQAERSLIQLSFPGASNQTVQTSGISQDNQEGRCNDIILEQQAFG